MVKVVNLSDDPDRVLTNNPARKKDNISNCRMSVILYHSTSCPACIHFHPIFEKFAKQYNKNGVHFFEMTRNKKKQVEDMIELLLGHYENFSNEEANAIPLTMIFHGNRMVAAEVGGMKYEELEKFVRKNERH